MIKSSTNRFLDAGVSSSENRASESHSTSCSTDILMMGIQFGIDHYSGYCLLVAITQPAPLYLLL